MVEEKRGIDVISGVSHALEYRRKHPEANEEEIMNDAMKFIKKHKSEVTKVDIIVGVGHALKLLERNNKLSDREVIDGVMKSLSQIIPQEE